jgi:hypothetical protein
MKTEASATKTKRTRRKRQKWQVGDYFLVPLLNGEFGLGQAVVVLDKSYVVICALFNIKVKSEEDAIERVKKLTEENVFSVVVTTKDGLDYSYWKVVCNDKPLSVERYIDLKRIESSLVGVEIQGSGIIDSFFNAFYSLLESTVF